VQWSFEVDLRLTKFRGFTPVLPLMAWTTDKPPRRT